MNRLSTCLMFLLFQSASAQTWQRYYPTFGFDVNTVSIPAPPSIVIGGGREANDSFQIMFHSNDYGHTWIENEHDGLAPWNKTIAFGDAANGLGAGNDGRIIRTDDGGLHWGFATYPINRDFNKIVSVNTQTYYAAGGNQKNDSIQTVVKTTDAGQSWTVVYDQPGPWLKSIYFKDTLNGIAVGDSGTILITANGGAVWAPVASPLPRDYNGITFLNADTGYIVGGNTNHRTVLRTDNWGTSWTVITDTTGGILRDISFADTHTGYAVGDSATVLKTTDGGETWLPVAVDALLTGNEEIRSVYFHDTAFGIIGGKQGLLYVYSLPLPYTIFRTEIPLPVSYTSVVLNGTVQGANTPMDLYFEYDTSLAFAHSVQANPSSVSDTLQRTVTAALTGLTPLTMYYCRLKGAAGGHLYYGNVVNFYPQPESMYSNIEAKPATQVTDTSAMLNGIIQNYFNATPVQVSFQFGTTPVLGFASEIPVGLVNVNDTLNHPVSAFVGGLSPDTVFYYYRLKVVAGSNVSYGTIRQLYTGAPEVPNWDFTHWQNSTAELPSRWKAFYDAPEKVPGNTGNALKISGKNVILMGALRSVSGDSLSGPEFYDAAPFHYRPDSVSVYLNYYVKPGDAAFLFVNLFTVTDTVAFDFIPITGNSGGVFQKISFPVTYLSNATPDSLVMGFITTNFFDGPPISDNNYLIIDDVSFGSGAPTVPNNSFENWFSYSYNRLLQWQYYQFFTAEEPVNTPMVQQALFDTAADYAVEVSNILLGGRISEGGMTTNSTAPMYDRAIGFAVAGKHQSLNGYYKYYPVNGDTLKLRVSLFNNHQLINDGVLMQADSVTEFTPFDIYVYYPNSAVIPDSATIDIETYTNSPKGLSRVIIDKLSFDGFRINVVDTFNYPSSGAGLDKDDIKVYPNPTHNSITVELSEPLAQTSTVRVYDVNGKQLKEIKLQADEPNITFSVFDLQSGFYFLRLQSGAKVFNKKIVVLN